MEIITEKDKLLNIMENKNLTSHTITELKLSKLTVLFLGNEDP